ncbi:MAG: hypothetical protein JW860_08660 [Sedimentisphaerales bacterium]|nr:hypothetical protein [Sedimentisphaerales bacterium]
MNQAQWQTIVNVIQGNQSEPLPAGFIIDSPWLPGWFGCTTLDYYTSDDIWFAANRRAIETFPEAIFLPGFWSEYGMCTEPSAFGAKCQWHEGNLPHAEKIIADIAEVANIKKPNVRTDGLLPFVINRLKIMQPQINEMGHEIKFAIARGPLNIASFLMGTTELMMAMMMNPDECHKFIDKITDFLVDWIQYQKEVFPSIDGILVLDDIIGFIGDQQCQDYVVPYFSRIFDSFDATINFLHNDAAGLVSAPYLPLMGVNLFNPSFEHDINELKKLMDNKVTILGNIPPRDVLAAKGPDEVREFVAGMLESCEDKSRLILSCGGGMPQDVPTENIRAFLDACR